jgi:hypothetical protein
MVRLGRAACFSRFGLQKTVTQLEELSPRYFHDAAAYCAAAARDVSMPSLFDVVEQEAEPEVPEADDLPGIEATA